MGPPPEEIAMTDPDPERIVVGVDAHGYAENAILVGIDLAARFGAELELVHAVCPRHALAAEATAAEVDQAREALLTRARASLSGACLEHDLAEHELLVAATRHPAQLLLERARRPGTSLLVLGRHRRRGLVDLGNTMRSVLSGVTCPVWVQAGPVRVVRHICVPVDMSAESLAALRTACAWALVFGARLTVLHAFSPPELFGGGEHLVPGPTYVLDSVRDKEKAAFDALVADFEWPEGLAYEARFVEDEPAHAILDLQDAVDLVVMGSHGRTGLSATLLGNVAARVMTDGHVPVVALRDPNRSWLL